MVTRERVLAAAEKLGYRRNPLVSALMAGLRGWHPRGREAHVIAYVESFPPGGPRQQEGSLQRYRNGVVAGAAKHGFGVQGPGQTTPTSDETIFRVFSMTKPIVAVTAMTLVQEGKLDLDAPVSKYLPAFANIKVWRKDGDPVASTKPMLVRHLMSHTSGIIYSFIQPTLPISKAWVAGGEQRQDEQQRTPEQGVDQQQQKRDGATHHGRQESEHGLFLRKGWEWSPDCA